MPGQSFQRLRHLEQLLDALLPHRLAQARLLLNRLLQSDLQLFWHQLGNPVNLRQGYLQHPAHVAQHSPRLHRAVGDNLGHMRVAAVLLAHVVNHLVPPVFAEVHVKVRHGHPLDVEEALKEQVVGDGVNVGDRHAVSGETACAGIMDGQGVGDIRGVRRHTDVIDLAVIGRAADLSDLQIDGAAIGIKAVVSVEQLLALLDREGGEILIPAQQLSASQLDGELRGPLFLFPPEERCPIAETGQQQSELRCQYRRCCRILYTDGCIAGPVMSVSSEQIGNQCFKQPVFAVGNELKRDMFLIRANAANSGQEFSNDLRVGDDLQGISCLMRNNLAFQPENSSQKLLHFLRVCRFLFVKTETDAASPLPQP